MFQRRQSQSELPGLVGAPGLGGVELGGGEAGEQLGAQCAGVGGGGPGHQVIILYPVTMIILFPVTSVLDIRDLGPGQAGVYTCTATNRGGRVADTRRVVIRDSDILEQLVRLKLYVMAGVGGCVVLLSSFIAAACIYTARRKEAFKEFSFKYSREDRGSWCDSDSVETVNDVKPFFKFGVRDKFVPGDAS